MKFDEIPKEKETPEVKTKKSKGIKSYDSSEIKEMYRVGNIGVYIMKHGKKGVFKDISRLINDGKKPTSWSIKIASNPDRTWMIQVGIHPDVDIGKTDIYLESIFEPFREKFDDIEIFGHRKIVTLNKIDDVKKLNSILRLIISMFKDYELDFEHIEIDPVFSMEESKSNIKISEGEMYDAKSSTKFIQIIKKISSMKMSRQDRNELNRIYKKIKEKRILSEKDKLSLNNLSEIYLTTHERVSIAMKYLKK